MLHPNQLFAQASLDESLLRLTELSAQATVKDMSRDQFLASNDDELVRHVVAKHTIEPLVIYVDRALMDEKEKQVDVSQDPNRLFFGDRPSRHFVAGTELTVTIPFTGTFQLWSLQTNPRLNIAPTADVLPAKGDDPGQLIISIAHPHDAKREQFLADYQKELKLIHQHLDFSKKQVRAFNLRLPAIIQTAIENRRAHLQKHDGLSQLLNIPLRPRPGAPPITPIRLPPRIIPSLPPVPSSAFKPEPGIPNGLFEQILAIIRHEGRTFETTPKTFAKHDEEELRDIMLAHLNGHFLGDATAEAFRKSGKTDIRIEDASRAAFVAECKVWEGAKKFDYAIDQLVGYLTWRDCKAAIVVFNKRTKNFSELLSKLPERLRHHENFISQEAVNEPGEWRTVLRSRDDEGRRIIVHTFLFDLFVQPR